LWPYTPVKDIMNFKDSCDCIDQNTYGLIQSEFEINLVMYDNLIHRKKKRNTLVPHLDLKFLLSVIYYHDMIYVFRSEELRTNSYLRNRNN